MTRILVTGSRDVPESKKRIVMDVIWAAALDLGMHPDKPQVVLVHGGCPTGADAFAHELIGKSWDYMIEEVHEAKWDEYERKGNRRAAGPARNKEMVDLGADVCLAFFMDGAQNRGTLNCTNLANKAGIPVVITKVPR